MIEDVCGRIDYDVCGAGPTIVLVPGSCSTGAAWRPLIAACGNQFRCVTTSLLGYGGTAERRTARDPSISHEADALESVIRRTGGRVHLIGHSFGGLVALAVAIRNRVPIASLVIVEAPAAELLRERGEQQHYRAFRGMTEAYVAAFEGGNVEAIATHQVLVRHDLFEIKRIEQLPLIPADPPQHNPLPSMFASARRNHCSAAASNDFCNKIDH